MRAEVYVGDLASLSAMLAREFAAEYAQALSGRGFFSIALPGGSVAVLGVPALATLPLDWHRIHIFWVDERAVPPSDSESNYAVAKTLWLDPARVPADSIHRMPADGPDLTVAADAYGAELTRVLGTPVRLDLVLLGVGSDGHVASLFPGHAGLSDEHSLVLPVVDAPKPPARRLTLTLPVLASAARVVVMAFGESKAAVIREALGRDDSELPVALTLRRAKRPLILVDEEAARLIQY
jgi:6-phosphogluconolactonase